MNQLTIIGRLTQTPELAETAGGTAICHFTVAVNRDYTDASGERQADFFRCNAWRGTAETVAKYAAKGDLIAVSGSVEINNYTAQDGSKRTSTEVQVSRVQFLSPKKSAAANGDKPVNLEQMDIDAEVPFK